MMPRLEDVPTWKLILLLAKELAGFLIPITLVMVMIIMLMKACGDVPM